MAPAKKSIDEIWKELNANAAPKRQWTRQTSSSTAKDILSVTGISKPKPKALHEAPTHTDDIVEFRKPASNYNPELAGIAPLDFNAYISSMQRPINCLTDADRSTRLQAITTIRDKLLSGDSVTPRATPQQLQAAICGPLLYPVAHLMQDTAEKIRTISIQLWTAAVQSIQDISPILPVLMPEIVKRIGVLPIAEPSEEVRLQLVQLVDLMLGRGEPRVLASYAQEVCNVLQQAQADSFHLIKKAGSTGVCSCCTAMTKGALEGKLDKVAQATVANLQHGHWRVRCSALQALNALMVHGLPTACVQTVVVPAIRPLAFDHSDHVRQQLFTAIAAWLGHTPLQDSTSSSSSDPSKSAAQSSSPAGGTDNHISNSISVNESTINADSGTVTKQGNQPERILTHAPWLLPTLLLGLTDPQESIATTVLSLVEGAGEAYVSAKAASGPGQGAASALSSQAIPAPADGMVIVKGEHVDGSRTPTDGGTGVEAKQGDVTQTGADGVAAMDEEEFGARKTQLDGVTAMDEEEAAVPSTQEDGTALREKRAGDKGERSTGGRDVEMAGSDDVGRHPSSVHVDWAWLGSPYKAQVGAACRQMVAELLSGLLQGLYSDLAEWTVALRNGAARCLHSCLVLAQGSVRPHLPRLLPALCSAVGDNDADVAKRVVSAVHVLGTFTGPDDWLPLLLDMGSTNATAAAGPVASSWSEAQRANMLVVLSGLLHAAKRCGHCMDDKMVMWLGEWLSQQAVCFSEAAVAQPVWRQLLAVVVNKLGWLGPRCRLCSLHLFGVLLHLLGSQEELPAAAVSSHGASVTAAMAQLAEHCGLPGVEQLAAQHAEALLPSISKEHKHWTAQSPSYFTLKALLKVCSAPTLARLLPDVAEILRACLLDEERDPNLRISMLQLVDELAEQERLALCFSGPTSEAWLGQLLLPCLVWRAGKVAAAIRFAAITAVGTILSRRLTTAVVLTRLMEDGMLPLLFQCLDEDWYADVRKSTCFAMQHLLDICGTSLSDQHVRSVYPELQKRLDDSNNGVRIAACQALVSLTRCLGPSYCSTNTGYLAAGVIIHMDDSDVEVRDAACAVLCALAAVKPAEVVVEVKKVREQFRAAHYCDRVLAACGVVDN